MDSHTSKVSRQFGAVAEAYLSSPVHSQGAELETIADRLLHGGRDARVLDLGCGAGHVSFAAAPHVRSVIAYDLSAEMTDLVAREAIRRNLRNISTQQGPAEKLPFEDATFDWVCTRYSAHHWTDVRKALRETRRVLKPRGGLIIADIITPADPLLDSHLQTIELLRDGSHVRDYSSLEWRSMIEGARFEVAQQQDWKVPIDFDAWIERMKTAPVYVAAIRSLLANAPQEVREYFQIAKDSSFVADAALIEAN